MSKKTNKDLHVVEDNTKQEESVEQMETIEEMEQRINVQEWVKKFDECKTDAEERDLISSVITSYYLPYAYKLGVIKGMIIGANDEKINGDGSWLVVDSPLRYITYIAAIIVGYTNFDFQNDAVNNYDALQSRGLIAKIMERVGSDVNEFTTLYNMVWDDFMVNESNPKVFIMRMIDKFVSLLREQDWEKLLQEFNKVFEEGNITEVEAVDDMK